MPAAADIVLEVEGMMCQKNCGTTVQKALAGVPAVQSAEVSFPEKKAWVWLKPEKLATNAQLLIEAVEDMGYEAKVLEDNRRIFGDSDFDPQSPVGSSFGTQSSHPDIRIKVAGMDETDAAVIERMLVGIEGVFKVEVDVEERVVDVWGYAEQTKIEAHLLSKGYRVELEDDLVEDTSHISNGIELTEYTQSPMIRAKTVPKTIKLRVNGSKQTNAILQGLKNMEHLRVAMSKRLIVIEYEEENFSERRLMNFLDERDWAKFIVRDEDNTSTTSTKREFQYSIRGMSCGNCAVKIEKTVAKMNGVVSASVSVMTHRGLAVVDHSRPNAVGPRDIMEKIKELGYDCELVTDEKGGGAAQQDNEHELRQWQRLLIISLVFGIPVVFLHLLGHAIEPLMMIMMEPALCHGGVDVGQLVNILLNSVLLVFVGWKFYRAAFISAYHGSFGMDFLVMTGTSVTFAYSAAKTVYACHLGVPTEHVFFEVTGMLLLFVTVGKYIEAYAKGRSASSVAELLKLQPRSALLVSSETAAAMLDEDANLTSIPDQDVQDIAVDLLQKGDIVKVLPGDRIPTDGRVVWGSSYVDESTITGESNPVRREKGDEVFGSTVNQDNCLYIAVTSYGADSALAQIVRLVESAQMSKAPVQQFADRLAGIFTPIVLLVALTTFLVWYGLCESHIVPRSWFEEEYNDPVLFSLLFSISVVVISCPCALGLATPTAIMVGTTVGATNGILIKGGQAFEVAHKVDTIVFDKTGTLTEGKPTLTDSILVGSNAASGSGGEDSLLVLAATAEQNSEHPLAQAIVRAAQKKHLQALPLAEDAAVSVVGSGVCCDSGLGRILVGNRGFMKAQDVTVTAAADAAMWNLEIQGKTAVCVALQGQIFGVLGIADVPKAEADSAVRTLRAMGIDIWMLTGDNATTAEALANKLDISQDRVLAGLLPQDKVNKVRELQAAGHVVAMVGDGVNDSPALAQADLGVAIGAGTQIAIEAASLVLVRSNLHDLVVSFDLAKVVFRRIRWNFLWALLYNVMAVPFAAGVWFPWTHILLPPHYAGLSMALSSVSVVISSMLLTRYRRPPMMDDLPVSVTESRSRGIWGWGRGSEGSSLSGGQGYDQLPRDEREWEASLGVDLGLGRVPISGRESWNAIRDDVV